jgi:hypothetical protein
MYSKTDKIFSGLSKLENYIEGNDVYNSKLLFLLSDPTIEREDYEILVHQYRPDLIAEDYYGDSSYEGLLILQSSMSLASFTKGTILHLIPKEILDSILGSL